MIISSADAPIFTQGGTTATGYAAPSRGARSLSMWRIALVPGESSPLHTLSNEEVFLALEGSATATIDGMDETVSAGDCLIVPPDRPFTLACQRRRLRRRLRDGGRGSGDDCSRRAHNHTTLGQLTISTCLLTDADFGRGSRVVLADRRRPSAFRRPVSISLREHPARRPGRERVSRPLASRSESISPGPRPRLAAILARRRRGAAEAARSIRVRSVRRSGPGSWRRANADAGSASPRAPRRRS